MYKKIQNHFPSIYSKFGVLRTFSFPFWRCYIPKYPPVQLHTLVGKVLKSVLGSPTNWIPVMNLMKYKLMASFVVNSEMRRCMSQSVAFFKFIKNTRAVPVVMNRQQRRCWLIVRKSNLDSIASFEAELIVSGGVEVMSRLRFHPCL